MNNSGIGKQVLGELGGVVKKAAEDTVKAGVEIVVGSPAQEVVEVEERQTEIKKRKGLDRVRKELADYVAKKKREGEQEEAVEERQEEIDKQEEEQKEETERDMQIVQAQRRGGGTGEISRKKH